MLINTTYETMKYLKKYEDSTKDEPQIGDYVICEQKEGFAKIHINSIIRNNIGIILEITDKENYIVYYDCDIPQMLKRFFNDRVNSRIILKNEIIYFSPNKEDLEVILSANKYNL